MRTIRPDSGVGQAIWEIPNQCSLSLGDAFNPAKYDMVFDPPGVPVAANPNE